jgi:hypothetical protein
LCNPNWGEILKQNVYVLTFIFIFEMVTRNFGFQVERQMKFVKHTHWWQWCARGSHTIVKLNITWWCGKLSKKLPIGTFWTWSNCTYKRLGMVMLVHRKLHSHDFPTHILFHLNILFLGNFFDTIELFVKQS